MVKSIFYYSETLKGWGQSLFRKKQIHVILYNNQALSVKLTNVWFVTDQEPSPLVKSLYVIYNTTKGGIGKTGEMPSA